MKQVFIRSSYYYYCEKPAWDVQSHSCHVKVLDFAPFCGLYMREFKLSHSNVVNRIIGYKNFSCTQIAREDVRLFPFYKLYKKEHILFTRLLCSIDFNKTPPFLTSTNI